jgi:hypothetical protein
MRYNCANLDESDRISLTQYILAVLDDWGVKSQDIISLLDLPEKTPKRMMRRYRDETPLPNEENVNTRLEHLFGIIEALRTTFPRNGHMASKWMNTPLSRMNSRTPLSVILEDGLTGLIHVRSHLDCTFSWSHSNS